MFIICNFSRIIIRCKMAESAATATAIPREINLGLQKPVATPAYTRRFKSQAGTPTVSAGSQVSITLDTAQPGSFIDTLSSYLSFKLDLVNDNQTTGYNVSFSACGAHALFRAMRIYVQGVPIEEITEYNALVEWLHDLTGIPDYCDRSAKSRYLANTMLDDQTIFLPAAPVGGQTRRSFNIQLPIVSGVLGTMAEKMFPSMLVAPGNCYIQLDVATAAHALRIMPVNVESLIVGTMGVGGAIATPQLIASGALPAATVFTGPTGLNARTSYVGVVDAKYSASNTNIVTAEDILEENPLDVPFVVADGVVGEESQGVLTTEERIGGGMFWNSASTPSSYSGMKVSKDIGNGSTNNVTIVSALSNAGATPAVFLGGGLTVENAAGLGGSITRLDAVTGVTFQLRDVEYIGKQVVVGDDVARAIIERAAAGDISIHTQSYRQYPATLNLTSWSYRVDPSYTNLAADITAGAPLCNAFQRVARPGGQSFIIPAKISSANAIYHIFRNGQSENNFWFDSLRRMTIGFTDGSSGSGGSSGINAQLRIGNELIPQSPIQSASESLEELLKAHHMGGHYGTSEKMGSVVASTSSYSWPNLASLARIRGSAISPVSGTPSTNQPVGREMVLDTGRSYITSIGGLGGYPRNDFNSQILCPSPNSVTWKFPTFSAYTPEDITSVHTGRDFLRPLGAAIVAGTPNVLTPNSAAADFYTTTSAGKQDYKTTTIVASVTADVNNVVNQVLPVSRTTDMYESQADYQRRQAKWKDAVKRAFFGYADSRSDHQITAPSMPNFMNPFKQHTGRYSTYMLGFDLDTFSHNTDTVRSGHYLGNNTVSLNLSDIELIDNSPLNMPLMSSLKMDTYILHDLRLSFQAGGIVQAFY